MAQDTLYELTRRSIPVSKNTGTTLSWRDSVVTVRTDKGMHFLDFSYNLECFHKDIDLYEFSIASPKNSPAESLCKSKFINNEMKNYDYTEMLLDSSFWPHNTSLTEEMTNIIVSAWSPPNFIENKSVLAVLNNIGGVEMLIQQQYQWKSILDLSPYCKETLEYNASPNTFEEMKKAVYIVETSSICWAPILNLDCSCYFVTAQKNSTILFWQIFKSEPPILKGKIQLSMSEIQNMIWVQHTATTFWLVCADVLGQVNVFVIQNDNGDFSLQKSHTLWEHKDRMIASHLQHILLNEKITFVYTKHRHLVIQVVDDNCKILTQHVNNINDYRITDIAGTVNNLYLSTVNVKIYKLKINLSGDTLGVEIIPVLLKESYNNYELYSLCFSNTNTLCVLGMVDRRLLCRKEVLKIDVIFLSTDSKLNSTMILLLDNPTKQLTDYWDCVEALRYNIIKTRTMPVLDYDLLYTEGNNEIYKLKIYLIMLTLYIYMRKLAHISSEFTLPETSVVKIKEKILLIHALSNIEKLYKKYSKNNELLKSEQEIVFGSFSYIKYYSKQYKMEVLTDKNMLKFGKNYKFEYVCQSCDCKITHGFMCDSNHLNMYCMLSFVPISDDSYLVCKCCDSTARTDLHVDNLLCVFCDQRLIKPD